MNFPKNLDIKNVKQYIPDIVIILILSLLAFLFSGKPEIDLSALKKKPPENTKQEIQIKRHLLKVDEIMERNLFAMDGRYTDTIQMPPENPYRLVAVMIGKDKKALLRDYKGQAFIAKEKDKMVDGYVIVSIRENSVVLKRGNQKKELTIFEPAKKP